MKSHSRAVVILACLSAVAVQAQWLETTLDLGPNQNPCALQYDTLDDRIYCADFSSNTVTVIDGLSNQVTASVPVGLKPIVLCHDPQNDKIYCSVRSHGDSIYSLSVIDAGSNRVISVVDCGVWIAARLSLLPGWMP